jgi:E3 ubiquitin-protein ligase HUWE1
VHRKDVFYDSYKSFQSVGAVDLRGDLRVNFHGEEGIDGGGLTREWYQILAREIFNQNYALFSISSTGNTYQPTKLSRIHERGQHLSYFKFIGQVIGKALYDS